MQERHTARARASFFLGGGNGVVGTVRAWIIMNMKLEAGSWSWSWNWNLRICSCSALSVCLSIYLSIYLSTTTTTTARERAQPQLHGLGRALQKRTLQERDTAALRDY